eukprot:6196692-Pleurochrysis_carterae.AAC.1
MAGTRSRPKTPRIGEQNTPIHSLTQESREARSTASGDCASVRGRQAVKSLRSTEALQKACRLRVRMRHCILVGSMDDTRTVRVLVFHLDAKNWKRSVAASLRPSRAVHLCFQVPKQDGRGDDRIQTSKHEGHLQLWDGITSTTCTCSVPDRLHAWSARQHGATVWHAQRTEAFGVKGWHTALG